MVKAFILVETVPGTGPKVASLLKALKEVQSVDRVTGPHDLIVIVETNDLKSLSGVLEQKVRSLPNIEKTLTCIVMAES